jgi:hypothetical protein
MTNSQLTFGRRGKRNVPFLRIWLRRAGCLLALVALGANLHAESTNSDQPPVPRLSPVPQSVAGLAAFRLDLDGDWLFNPAPPTNFWKTAPANGKPIRVPGEWTMQGFTVAPNVAAAYTRTFTVPAEWQGHRIKLRCEAVYSDAVVWINGQEAGRHLGGFTPFELNVTGLLRPGKENRISIAVKNNSLADRLARGSQYAAHPLGGITRSIYLLALPQVNVACFQVATRFDAAFRDASLQAQLQVANEGTKPMADLQAEFALSDPQGRPVAIDPARLQLPPLAPGENLERTVEIPVGAPAQWDPEHPNLYVLRCRLLQGGAPAESVERRFGFRQIEVRGNQLFLNNHPVKLHGVCRHEMHPLLGRSLTPELWRQDAELYRAGNCNYIRTSHYPPGEEFIAACDEVGLLVEEEAPFCWATHNNAEAARAYTLQAELEMVQRDRSHPSVILWSLGNESEPLATNFARAVTPVRTLDPTRPLNFEVGNFAVNAKPPLDVETAHYPSRQDISDIFANHPRPVILGEYCHLNAYNRREQIGDPGLRDLWGLGLETMWEAVRAAHGCAGGSIWAAMDDTFFLPDGRTVGYGTWGPLDGWRRPKPEYWNMAKTYSPVRIVETNATLSADGQSVQLTVENRDDFANLSEFKFAWTLADHPGIAMISAEPGKTGVLTIPATRDLLGKALEIRVIGPRGFLVDAYDFVLGGEKHAVPPPLRKAGPVELVKDTTTIAIRGSGFRYVLDAVTGQLRQGYAGRHELALEGPCLTLVPLDKEGGGTQMTGREPSFAPLWGLCTNWTASSVTAAQTGQMVTVNVAGAYSGADGGYEMAIDGTGRVQVSWRFTLKDGLNPRQTGITFTLPGNCQTLSWHRRGQWSWYPEDHIGRLTGTAKAFPGHPACGLAGPRTQPTWPWAEDQNEYGCNDFRSTKCNIFLAQLTDGDGIGLRAVAAADRHAHAWMDGGRAHLLVADYVNDGAEGFFQMTRAISDRPIAKGGVVAGSAQVELVEPALQAKGD